MLTIYLELIKPIIYLGIMLLAGSAGYSIIEGWSWLEAFYMTVITVASVGYGEVHPLSPEGRVFTIFLILSGVVFYGIAINFIFKILLETNFKDMIARTRLEGKIHTFRNHYVIAGGGRMACSIARELETAGKKFVIIETNPNSPANVHKEKWPILAKDALLEESLLEAGISHAAGLASVLPTDADNLYVVLSARRLNPDIRIETRISQESSRSKMLQAGADKVVSPYVLGGLQIARSFLEPQVEEFLDITMARSNYEFELKVHHITVSDPNAGKKLGESDFHSRNLLVVGVRDFNGKFHFAPDGHTILREGMEVLLMQTGQNKSEIKDQG